MKTIVVTGGAGFIGSNLIKKLNEKGFDCILIVDNLQNQLKWKNILDLKFYDFVDYKQGIDKVAHDLNKVDISAIFHIGANADVLVTDASVMLNLNFEYSKAYLDLSLRKNIPFIYASSSAVYGHSASCHPSISNERPHNLYALSKWMLDNYIRRILKNQNPENKIMGFRFFNTYGVGEFHKGKNASLVYRFYDFIKTKKFIDLFEGAEKIKRDYIWVNDLVRVLIFALENELDNGIYNLGSGLNLSHKALAEIIIDNLLTENVISGSKNDFITYIPFPPELKKTFQFFTKSEHMSGWITSLNITEPKIGIGNYIDELMQLET